MMWSINIRRYTNFVLVYTIYAARDTMRGQVSSTWTLVIGLMARASVLAAGPFFGGSINPACAFGSSSLLEPSGIKLSIRLILWLVQLLLVFFMTMCCSLLRIQILLEGFEMEQLGCNLIICLKCVVLLYFLYFLGKYLVL